MIVENCMKAPYQGMKNEMSRFEFFECYQCERICMMPIEAFNQMSDFEKMNSQFECERCTMLKKVGRPKKEGSEPIENKDMSVLKKDIVTDITSVNMVDKPPHYTAGDIECIDAIKAAVQGLEPFEAALVANIMKYIWRYKRKNGKQDLQKAEWYLRKLMEEQI